MDPIEITPTAGDGSGPEVPERAKRRRFERAKGSENKVCFDYTFRLVSAVLAGIIERNVYYLDSPANG